MGRDLKGEGADQFSVGTFSMRSITTTSWGVLVFSNLSPSCFSRAVNKSGAGSLALSAGDVSLPLRLTGTGSPVSEYSNFKSYLTGQPGFVLQTIRV